MIVAATALEGEAEEGGAEGGHAVVDVIDAVFLLDGAALGFLWVEAVESGGEDLIVGRVRQEIAGELIGNEFVPAEIFVEGLDDPVAPRPHLALAVHLEAVAIGVAGDIEPVGGHTFAVAGGSEEAIDDLGQGVGRAIGEKRIDFREGRREAGEVEGKPANKGGAVGCGLGCEFAAGEPVEREPVDGRRRERRERGGLGFEVWDLGGRSGHGGERLEGPVVLKGCTLVDPALEDGDFRRREAADFCVGRRHHFLRVGAGDAEDDFALRASAGDDYGRAILFTEGSLAGIEAEFAFAAALIGAVAMEALVREDRPHLAAKIDRCGGTGDDLQAEQEGQKSKWTEDRENHDRRHRNHYERMSLTSCPCTSVRR